MTNEQLPPPRPPVVKETKKSTSNQYPDPSVPWASSELSNYLRHQELLLRPNHGARPADSDPGDGLGRGHPVMLHDVAGYQGARSSKAS